MKKYFWIHKFLMIVIICPASLGIYMLQLLIFNTLLWWELIHHTLMWCDIICSLWWWNLVNYTFMLCDIISTFWLWVLILIKYTFMLCDVIWTNSSIFEIQMIFIFWWNNNSISKSFSINISVFSVFSFMTKSFLLLSLKNAVNKVEDGKLFPISKHSLLITLVTKAPNIFIRIIFHLLSIIIF